MLYAEKAKKDPRQGEQEKTACGLVPIATSGELKSTHNI